MTDAPESLLPTIKPKTDQLNYDDLTGGRKIIVTVSAVRQGSAEQPVIIDVDGDWQPYKPCKGMRRVLIEAWGEMGARDWPGRSMELFGNPAVKYGGVAVGGIQISRVSHIDKPQTTPLTVTRGKRVPFTVGVLDVQQKPSRVDVFRKWLAENGRQESDAVAEIGSKPLEQATESDWNSLRAWAK